jgi:hypothetical protein
VILYFVFICVCIVTLAKVSAVQLFQSYALAHVGMTKQNYILSKEGENSKIS